MTVPRGPHPRQWWRRRRCHCANTNGQAPLRAPTPAPTAPKSVPDDAPAGAHGLHHVKRRRCKTVTAPRGPPPSATVEAAASLPLCQRQRTGAPARTHTRTHRPQVSAGRCNYRGAWPVPCETTMMSSPLSPCFNLFFSIIYHIITFYHFNEKNRFCQHRVNLILLNQISKIDK